MASAKQDRRVRKTRALLLKGLIQLMSQKDIKDISVKELADLVDINRGTFYLHYNDIYDMLEKIEDELFLEFNEFLNRNLAEGGQLLSPYSTMLDLFTLLEGHKDLAKVLIGSHGDLAFVNRLKALVEERLRHLFETAHNTPAYEYCYPFIVSGCVGIIEAWLNHPAPLSPEEMAGLCSTMLNHGLAGMQ
ncbi:MAG: TetR-like C-terminal domain-containing protein [Acetatifactor sp.]